MVRSFSSRSRVAASMMLATTAITRQRKAMIMVTNNRGGYSRAQARQMRLTAAQFQMSRRMRRTLSCRKTSP